MRNRDLFLGFSGIILLFFTLILLRPLFGAILAVLVGIFFSGPILGTLAAFGVTGITMWQLGATLGFVSGFFYYPKTDVKV